MAEWVDADDLKSSGQVPCRFDPCPGYHPLPPRPRFGSPLARLVPRSGTSRLPRSGPRFLENALSNSVGFEQVLQGVAVEERRA